MAHKKMTTPTMFYATSLSSYTLAQINMLATDINTWPRVICIGQVLLSLEYFSDIVCAVVGALYYHLRYPTTSWTFTIIIRRDLARYVSASIKLTWVPLKTWMQFRFLNRQASILAISASLWELCAAEVHVASLLLAKPYPHYVHATPRLAWWPGYFNLGICGKYV